MPRERARIGRWPLVLGAVVLGGAILVGVGRRVVQNAPGRIEIETEPIEAEIFIDGQKMADRSPMFLDASPGHYRLVVRSPGYVPVERVLEMKPRAQDVVALVLVPTSPPKVVASPPPRQRGTAAAVAPSAPRKKAGTPSVDGVTFIDFKQSAAGQRAR